MADRRQRDLLDRVTDAALRDALPRGPHGLTREQVRASQRGRLLDAMAQTVAEQGYAATSVADVIARAGVSRRTFYEEFDSKQDAFLAAYETIDIVLVDVAAAASSTAEPRERIRRGLATYLELLRAEPAFAHMFVIEAFAAGPAALARRAEIFERFADLLRIAAPDEEIDDRRLRAALGAVHELVVEVLRRGRSDELPELTEVATDVVSTVIGLR